MWCQNCGKLRAHYHSMGSDKAKYCERCRSRSTTMWTYCRFCGENRYDRNDDCDVHYGNPDSRASSNSDYSDSLPDSHPAYDDDDNEDEIYGTDASSPRSLSPPHAAYARTKCGFCDLWFDTESDYDDHKDENSSECLEHKVCFPSSENYEHAKDSHHRRCFLVGCDSVYAEDSDNSDDEIMDHVWNSHTHRG